jgi:hypothetical protein
LAQTVDHRLGEGERGKGENEEKIVIGDEED